jgi:protein involved in polysaccharide export with SLBB domain
MMFMMRGNRGFPGMFLGAALVMNLLAGCATTAYPPLPASEMNKPRTPYTLDVGDKLRVTVFREPELSGEFSVGGSGQISMPLLGEVPVKGLTRADVEAELTRRFANGLLRDPRVAVDIYDFRTFAILGEVQRPGTFPAKEGTSITDAIAMAGGYTYRANEKRILIRRARQGPYYTVNVDANVEVGPGDTIKVEEVHF